MSIVIPPYFEPGDVNAFYEERNHQLDHMHAAIFEKRKGVKAEQAIELASELPNGAFVAGGFMRSFILGQAPRDYDVFFDSQESLMNLVRRVQNAPEGSFLHGYTGAASLREFGAGFDKFVRLVHSDPKKPPIKLHRARWFRDAADAVNHIDFTISRFALDNRLTVVSDPRSIGDARSKRLRLVEVSFPSGSGLRISRFELQGYTWYTDNYDSYYRADYKRWGNDKLAAAQKEARKNNLPVPQNDGDFGLFVP